MHQKLIPDPFLILVNNQKSDCMQGIILQIRYFQRELSKSFKNVNFIFSFEPYVIRMSLVCYPYVTRIYSYVIRMSLVCTRTSLVCTRMSSVSRSYVLVCHSYVTGLWFYHEPSFFTKGLYFLGCLFL